MHWSWAELGVQIALAVVFVAIAAAVTNAATADGYRKTASGPLSPIEDHDE